jgi:single stranded DNA-binding protein
MDGLVCAFIGRVGQDAELKWTQNGTSLVNVSVLVQDSKASEGERQWIRVGHFGDDAEDLSQQLVKGTEVYVEGRLKMNTWTGQDGAPRSGLNVTAWKLEPVGQIGRRAPRPMRAGTSSSRRQASSGRLTNSGPLVPPAKVDTVARMAECLLAGTLLFYACSRRS